MRYSQTLIPTVKEVPAEAEIPSHQLMIRAGFIRKLASGTYYYLPAGLRTLRKIAQVIREEMDAAGAQEIDMPFVQPMELWGEQGTGRRADYGETLGWFTDRHGRENALSPTAEEIVTHLVAGEIDSYKQLPVNLYQIKMKYRDEFRPRFGVLRSREFVMKDGYSFDATLEGLDASYQSMREAYCRIFSRCGIPYVVVQAQAGEIGGSGSEEFMVPCAAGEDVIVHTADGAYAANIEKAEVDSAKPDYAAEATGELEAVETPDCKSIEDVMAFFKKNLGTKLKAANMLKTLVLRATFHEDGDSHPDWLVAVVRGDHELNEFKLTALVRGTYPALASLDMADENEAKAAGFPIGYVGPHILADVAKSVMVVDPSAAQGGFWVTGGNGVDLHAKHFNWRRDVMTPLGEAAGSRVLTADIRNAAEGDTRGGAELTFSKGIEVGHIFKLGSKYSKALGATFTDESGAILPCIMGCYGIGVNRIFASAIEAAHDENGCVLPISIAPFEVEVVQVNGDSAAVRETAEGFYNELKAAGVDVLLDDRDARPGVKFKDADLLGVPLRIVVGDRGLKDGNVEIKRRTDEKPTVLPVGEAVAAILAAREEMFSALVK